jgi:hypothetical protein
MKRYKVYILLICCLFLITTNQGQDKDSRKYIIELKKGFLLIRLSTREKTVEDLKRMGKTRAAEEIRKEQELKNSKIVAAFKKYFTFCDYRFFYSQYSNEIKNKNFKFLLFDKELKPDANFELAGKNFYVAEFGILQADTAKISKETRLEFNKDFSAEEVPVYYQNTPNKLYALIIKDNQYYQLKYPFPYYVAGFNTDRAVKKMNQKLSNYYTKTIGTK